MIPQINISVACGKFFLLLSTIVLSTTGCEKILEVDTPVEKQPADIVYNNVNAAVEVMSGIYLDMSGSGQTYHLVNGERGIPIRTSFLSDELTAGIGVGSNRDLYRHSYPTDVSGYWNTLYTYIFRVNSLIEGVSASDGIAASAKKILLAEAKFIRAYCYFALVNFYGDVPLVLTTDYTANLTIPRTDKSLIYDQIISDILTAQTDLSDNYLSTNLISATDQRVRPNKAAATAFLARVYLYNGKWAEAEAQSTLVINNPNYSLLTDLNQVFLMNSQEAIWQVQPNSNPGSPFGGIRTLNTQDGYYFIPFPDQSPKNWLSPFLLDAFEPNDKRRTDWVLDNDDELPVPYKYKLVPYSLLYGLPEQEQGEFVMVLRLAEQYLIRAEARAHLNKLTGVGSAEEDLNAIRNRAGLPPTTAATQTELLTAILHERQVELFTEGHRWFDLIRTGNIDDVMYEVAPEHQGNWAPFKAIFPIPKSEFTSNTALQGHQNPGYSE